MTIAPTKLLLRLCVIILVMTISFASAGDAPRDERSPSVGMSARIEQIVLPGSELVVKPIEDYDSPVIVRIVETYPHGDAFRYDMIYYGLDPGTYDLRDYLQRADRTSLDDLQPINIEVRAVLPPGQIEPHKLNAGEHPSLGGYRTLTIVLGVNWVLGLLLIVFYRRGRRATGDETSVATPCLADRLRPYVDDAIAGKLTRNQLAQLERMLLAHWRGRLGLE
ncbi:MAG: hypothetical protein CMJ48_14375 [Planctomycetaceae bacterium]|nr:hypothetical protein [Planctomycetaceae bacterium]